MTQKTNNTDIRFAKDAHISIIANKDTDTLSVAMDGDLTDIALIIAYLMRKHKQFARAIRLAQTIQIFE